MPYLGSDEIVRYSRVPGLTLQMGTERLLSCHIGRVMAARLANLSDVDLVEGPADDLTVLAVLDQRSKSRDRGAQVEFGRAEAVKRARPVQGLGYPRGLQE